MGWHSSGSSRRAEWGWHAVIDAHEILLPGDQALSGSYRRGLAARRTCLGAFYPLCFTPYEGITVTRTPAKPERQGAVCYRAGWHRLAHAGCAEGFAHVQRFKHAGRTHAIDTAPLDEQMRLSSRVYQAQPVAHGILLPGGQGDQFRALPRP
jgi:hypothetical protein